MTSYSKTATTIELYDVPRSIAEDPRIAFLQSNLFWQVGCAKSKTKACTEISAWTKAIKLNAIGEHISYILNGISIMLFYYKSAKALFFTILDIL